MERYRCKNQKNLRCGVTTGTCAAAAALAAARELLLGIRSEKVTLRVPKGTVLELEVYSCLQKQEGQSGYGLAGKKEYTWACYGIRKDSGDDPDVTNGAEILVTITKVDALSEEEIIQSSDRPVQEFLFSKASPKGTIYLDGGEGIGRITQDGLEQEIGQAAINAVPREMIFGAVCQAWEESDYEGDLFLLVSVPEGKKLAEKTFNPKLGIEGGLSILGTSGILEPMSEQAIVDTTELQIRQLSAKGEKKLLLTPGNYGMRYASECLKLDLEAAVKCSNFIGDALDFASFYGMETVLLVGNFGKLVKLAAGIMNTHSKVADARGETVAAHLGLCGGSSAQMKEIMECVNTDQMLGKLQEYGLREQVIQSLLKKIEQHGCARLGNRIRFAVFLFSERFGYLGETPDGQDVLARFLGGKGQKT